jgi:poly-beta-1,6-N-acetyl-D-glucosamine synthase
VKLLFWLSVSLIFLAYAGYPIFVYLRARYRPRPVRRGCMFPSVTVVLAAHNEGRYLSRKLENLDALDYPAECLEVIVVSDGSTDRTNTILREWSKPGRRALILPEHQGKAVALNHGMAEAAGDIVCFTDARQTIAPDGLKRLIENFADPSVGCASGALTIGGNPGVSSSEGVGLYWQLEKNIRNWEALAGSTVGATGAFYAVRANLLSPLPAGTILDDVYIPLEVARKGGRVIFDREASVWDDFSPSPKQEFRRKVRTLAGNYQLLQVAPWVLTGTNPLRLQLIGHKLLRLLVPFALVGVLVSTAWLHTGLYEFVLGLQILLYALAGLTALHGKAGVLSRLSSICLAFILLNTAAALALVYFLTGRKAAWAR